jgi:hypothetical protein
MILGTATDAAHCKTFTYLDAERPQYRHTTVCIRAPVWIVHKKHWRLVGSRIVVRTLTRFGDVYAGRTCGRFGEITPREHWVRASSNGLRRIS